MEESNTPQGSLIAASFQAHLQDKECFFQVIDLFPMPIEIFAPDGVSVFVNCAFLECFNISEPAKIVGKLNILNECKGNNRINTYLRSLKLIFPNK